MTIDDRLKRLPETLDREIPLPAGFRDRLSGETATVRAVPRPRHAVPGGECAAAGRGWR